MDKLPKYLWDSVHTQPMPGPGVTEREINRIIELQKSFLAPETENRWAYRLSQVGLTNTLRQAVRHRGSNVATPANPLVLGDPDTGAGSGPDMSLTARSHRMQHDFPAGSGGPRRTSRCKSPQGLLF